MKDFLTTLIVNGFYLSSVNRIADGIAIINVFRYDKFGAKVNYSFLFSDKHVNEGLIESLITTSSELKTTPVVVSDYLSTDKWKNYKIENFYDLIGGYVNTGLILIVSVFKSDPPRSQTDIFFQSATNLLQWPLTELK